MIDIEINGATLLETMLFGSSSHALTAYCGVNGWPSSHALTAYCGVNGWPSSHALTAYCGVNGWQNISGYSVRKCENTSNTESLCIL